LETLVHRPACRGHRYIWLKEEAVDYFLTEEQKMIKELARQIAEEHILPVRAELDETGEFHGIS